MTGTAAPSEVKALHDDLKSTFAHFEKAVETQNAEIAKHGTATAETKSAIDALNEKMGEIELKLSRPGGAPAAKGGARVSPEYAHAFMDFMRKGNDASPDSLKTLTRGDDTTGGYLAPDERVAEIIKAATEVSEFRDIVTVRKTSKGAVSYPKRTGQFAAVRVGEGATRSETTGWTVGRERIPIHAMHALVKISREDLDDAEVNLEQIMNEEAGEQFGVKEGAEFVSGTGVEEAEGILTNAAVIAARAKLGSTTIPTYGKMVDLLHSLKTAYFNNATWIMNLGTLGAVRQVVDGDGRLVWQPDMTGTSPGTILGRPYKLIPDMPAISSASNSIAVGDFKRAYVWGDRTQMEVQRLVEKFADEGVIGFQFFGRSGGQVVLPEAIQVGYMSA